jgi:anti-sigma regulatory factor (Ser/Thr protein kinase)
MISVWVTEASQVADARRRLVAICQRIGFDEVASGRAAIVATELATNLVKYGQAGEMLLGTYEDETGAGIEIIAIDKGPGLANIDAALRDGHSTGGSAGEGLGAVRRQSQTFDVASWPGRGTAVLARLEAHPTPSTGFPAFGGVEVPMHGEVVCGDAFCTYGDGASWTAMVADGLGHGPNAAQASQEAVRVFRRNQGGSPSEILAAIHVGIKHTRGGAVSIARYDGAGRLSFTGVGNVAGAIVNGAEIKRTVSMPGTVGHVMRRVQSFEYPFPAGSRLVMCSDGIGTTWSLDRYPGLIEAHPSLIAAIIYRDFARGRDDATVLVAGVSRS